MAAKDRQFLPREETTLADAQNMAHSAEGSFRRQAGDFSGPRVAMASCAHDVQAPMGEVAFRAGAAIQAVTGRPIAEP